MPAIQLARLNDELSHLLTFFDQPADFTRVLQELLEKYAAWSFRPGEVTRRHLQVAQYHSPALVMQKLAQAIKPACEKEPQNALALADLLWGNQYYEMRLVAARILNCLPLSCVEEVVTRMQNWVNSNENQYLVAMLLEVGGARLRTLSYEKWLELMQGWMDDEHSDMRRFGLRAALVSIKDRDFRYLPNIFQMVTLSFLKAQHDFRPLLHEILEALIERSPVETSFFLRQLLLRQPAQETKRIIRKNLVGLPADVQRELRDLLSEQPDNES